MKSELKAEHIGNGPSGSLLVGLDKELEMENNLLKNLQAFLKQDRA